MRSVGIKELKSKASEIVREVKETKHPIAITVRGREVARIVPATRRMPPEEIAAWMKDTDDLARRIGALWPEGLSAVEAVREQRDRF